MKAAKGINGAGNATETIDWPEPGSSDPKRLGPGPIAPAPVLPTPKRRRRPALIAIGVMLAVLAAVGTYWLVTQSSDRVAVVGVARDVAWGEVIDASDLVQVQIVQDPSLLTVPWSAAGTLVGKRAAVDLQEGALLTPKSLTSADAVPAVGQAMVGVSVKSGQHPSTALVPGAEVLLVTTPDNSAGDESAEVPTVRATVFSVGAVESGGGRTVDVLVDEAAATDLAVAVAQGRVSIVLVPRG